MPAVNRVPAVHGADAIEPPPAYQPVAFQHFPANRPVLPMDKRNKFLTFREWRKGERERREAEVVAVGRVGFGWVGKAADTLFLRFPAPTLADPDALVVKFQTIVREEREIVVGRLKVQTVCWVSLSTFVIRAASDAETYL
jgi:hypothetical protein